ncbi:hypothetical protein [Jannaschia ovalis]|uniref:Uncharacterized protein n=1 Tax=Jannaschia ovalis TaxID=3038773 RepID=A0ABY8LGT0_9RHOB|nr:hypothetical protein [Jannaschia sp. GRR-S6-38]WGH79340.1 hypothetical protein P8627_03485 [Jannaschia sp. GRR-S6-38]
MTDMTRSLKRTVRLGYVVVPAAGLAGILAAVAVTIGTAITGPETAYDAIQPEQIAEIEFLSQSGVELDAVDAACALTGCAGAEITRVLRAEAAAMTGDELSAALRDQARTLSANFGALDAATGDQAAMLKAENAALLQIVDLYRHELRARR